MVFSSTSFLFIFLPAVYILYLIVPGISAKNVFLIIASLLFYAFGEPFAVLLMIGSVMFSYLCGIGIDKSEKLRKIFMAAGVIGNLGLLFVYKYASFFLSFLDTVLPFSIPVPQINLPIGISFFIFQAVSYIIDVFRRETSSQKNPFKLLLYISFFPQLIAGPIIKYHDISEMISNRSVTFESSAKGIRRFICGLAKKILIANTIGAVADAVFEMKPEFLSMPTAWLGAICYTLQIYFDFSGYSDMAIGLGAMFGFTFKENFNYPYSSKSITDFWRRWHISVSTWFKEYLYFPLGGNRKGKVRTVVNKWIVFLCTGFWHGANWTFLIWGALNGVFLTLEQYQRIPAKKIKWKPLAHIYTMLAVVLMFVVFRANSLPQAGTIYKAMFTCLPRSLSQLSAFTQLLTPTFIAVFVIAVIASAPVLPRLRSALQNKKYCPAVCTASYVLSLPLFILCVLKLSVSAYNPFIYFRF